MHQASLGINKSSTRFLFITFQDDYMHYAQKTKENGNLARKKIQEKSCKKEGKVNRFFKEVLLFRFIC